MSNDCSSISNLKNDLSTVFSSPILHNFRPLETFFRGMKKSSSYLHLSKFPFKQLWFKFLFLEQNLFISRDVKAVHFNSMRKRILWPEFPQLWKFWKFDPQYLVIKIQQIVFYYINFHFFTQFWPFFTIFSTFSLKKSKISKNVLVTLIEPLAAHESERSDVWESSLERASDGQNPVEKAEGYCGSNRRWSTFSSSFW